MNTPLLFLTASGGKYSVRIVSDAPPDWPAELIKDAIPKYYYDPNGSYMEQGILGKDCSLYQYDFFHVRKQMWSSWSGKHGIAIFYMLKNSVQFQFADDDPVTFKEGFCYLLYIPPGSERALFLEGHTVIVHLNVSVAHLKDLAEEDEPVNRMLILFAQQSWYRSLAAKVRISPGALLQINRIKNYGEDRRNFSAFLNARIMDALLEYVRGLELAVDTDRRYSDRSLVFSEQILAAKTIIDENQGTKLSVHGIARRVGLTVRNLQEGFKRIESLTVAKYQKQVRLKKASELLLQENRLSVYKIGMQVGFEDESSFISAFKKLFDITPFQYRKRYQK